MRRMVIRGLRRTRRLVGRFLGGAPHLSEMQPGWREHLVQFAYRHFLGREPSDQETFAWADALKSTLTPGVFLEQVAHSEEARNRLPLGHLGDDLSDGEFLVRASRILFGRGLLPSEVATLQRQLEISPGGRLRFASDRINDQLRPTPPPEPPTAQTCVILGTSRILSRGEWDDRRQERLAGRRHIAMAPNQKSPFAHSDSFKVSMIASLYRGGRFIERFLENITTQTMFHSSELIIIDADSPEGEWETIERYQKLYANIIYKRVGFRIGIYEAWNLGVALARGAYITNTNLDDLRRNDSIELQAAFLDNNPGVDVAYQEFFYSLDADLSFEEVAELGFKSELPIVTRHNLLGCNSPHNAPMWRKSLHDSVGLFDPIYRSGGDHEFWLRCLSAGHTFGKINTPHVAYFQNPEGMSTKPDTPGVQESYETFNRHSAKLISPVLLDTRQGFMTRLGCGEVPSAANSQSYYEIAQEVLLRLAKNHPASTPVVRRENGKEPGQRRAIRILLDGMCFQHAKGACAPILTAFSARSHLEDGFDLFVLDRGGCPPIEGLQRIDFPSYNGSYTAADSLQIQERCDAFDIDVFTSAGCTTALATPQLQIIPEGWGLEALSGRTIREEKERCLAIAYSSRLACLTELARAQLLLIYPNEAARVFPVCDEQALATEVSDGQGLWLGLCDAWRQTVEANSGELAVLFYRDWTRVRSLQAEVDVGID